MPISELRLQPLENRKPPKKTPRRHFDHSQRLLFSCVIPFPGLDSYTAVSSTLLCEITGLESCTWEVLHMGTHMGIHTIAIYQNHDWIESFRLGK